MFRHHAAPAALFLALALAFAFAGKEAGAQTLPATAGEAAGDAAKAAVGEGPVICQVAGYDVVLVNRSEAPVPAGTSVAWSVRFARMEDAYMLESDLLPGAIHVLTGALGSSYLGTRTPCAAEIVDPDAPAETATPP